MILEFPVVNYFKYFRIPNKILKFKDTALLLLRATASMSALALAFASLIWLQQRMLSLETPKIGPWDTDSQKIPLVLLDAGHGGHDGGAVANGAIEKNLTLEITRYLKDELTATGLRVAMTREKDAFLPLEERAALTAKTGADVFISVHINTDGDGATAEGVETYFAGKPSLQTLRKTASQPTGNAATPDSAELAALVQRNVCKTTESENRGVKQRGYVVIEEAVCPAVLVECGFLTHPLESKKLKDTPHQKKIAQGIAAGVQLFLQTRDTPPLVVGAAP